VACAAGEQVPHRFVALPGFGLCQGAELAQRLELIRAGFDPRGFAQLGFPCGGGRGVGRQLRPRDVVALRVVDRAGASRGEQPVDAFPLRKFRAAVPGGLPGEEVRILEGGRDGVGGHARGAAAHHAPADAGGVDRFARAGRTVDRVPGRSHRRLSCEMSRGRGSSVEPSATRNPKRARVVIRRPPLLDACSRTRARTSGCQSRAVSS
jgi:hypothetical protein